MAQYRSVLPLGKKLLTVGQRLNILELLIMEGPQSVNNIAASCPIIGNVLTNKQLHMRLANWLKAYETETVECPISFDGHEWFLNLNL